MKRILLKMLIIAIVIWGASLAFAQDPLPTPATQPASGMHALPPGHPDISGMTRAPATQPSAPTPALPKGHPDLSGMMPSRQPGAQLPAGHPDISGMAPSTQPGATRTGSLTIRAVQGTVGGPAIGSDPISVQVLRGDEVLGKIDTELNDQGFTTIDGMPVGPMFRSLVTVNHAGVEYQAVASPGGGSAQTMTVTVYETTDKPVGWEVRMRHVMIQPTAEGVQVMDMLAIDNATDRAYIGTPAADESKTTFELPLPPNATNVQLLGGFHDCCTKIENGRITNSMAIIPGTTQYRLAYTVPMTGGKAQITTAAPAITKNLIIFAPDDGTTITASGLETGTANMGDRRTRFFKGTAVPANQAVTLQISGTPTGSPAASGSPARGAAGASDLTQIAKLTAGLGGLLILLFGGAMLVRKSPGTNSRS